jgi:hypothetical protein
MPRPKLILPLICLATAALAAGCGGGDDEPEPSIPQASAVTLVSTLQEVQDNVDVGSCLIAQDKVQEFQEELSQLPSDVNADVVDALQKGGLNLGTLVEEDCDRQEETTTEETETQDTETQDTETQETDTTQPTETQAPPTTTTTPQPPPNTGGGGVGPPGSDGL